MNKTRWMTGTLIAIASAGALMSAPSYAQIYVQVAPPAPRFEAVPQPRRGHQWVPGHWQWRGNRYVWAGGYYVAARPGYYYAQPTWVQNGDRWAYRSGSWARGDRDHDGIPNRYDRDRDGDGIANRNDRTPNGGRPHMNRGHDRDGDGVPNRLDSNPNNPRRN